MRKGRIYAAIQAVFGINFLRFDARSRLCAPRLGTGFAATVSRTPSPRMVEGPINSFHRQVARRPPMRRPPKAPQMSRKTCLHLAADVPTFSSVSYLRRIDLDFDSTAATVHGNHPGGARGRRTLMRRVFCSHSSSYGGADWRQPARQ